MSRHRRHDDDEMPVKASKWLGALILAFIAGAVAYPVIDKGFDFGTFSFGSFGLDSLRQLADHGSDAQTATSTEPTATSTEQMMFGVSVPKADRDRLFKMELPLGKVTEESKEKGWRISKRQTGSALHVEGNFLKDGGEWNVPLRDSEGQNYTNAQFLGLDGDKTAIVLASDTGPEILRVDRSGAVRVLFRLPENANVVGSSSGTTWIATFTPGEGIESEPAGPSTLIRVTSDGIRADLVQETRVIVFVTAASDERFAYQTDDGGIVARNGEKKWSGDGKILGWYGMDLIIGQGKSVFRLDQDFGLKLLGSLPEAPNVVY